MLIEHIPAPMFQAVITPLRQGLELKVVRGAPALMRSNSVRIYAPWFISMMMHEVIA